MFYRLSSFLCLLLAGAFMLSMTAAAAAQPLMLNAAVTKALAASPELAAMKARAQALVAISDQVETLPDPHLSINMLNLPLDSLSFSQEAMTQLQLGITQALPYPGKLALRAQVASQEADAVAAEVTEQRLQLVRAVKTVWWNIFYYDRALEVVARNEALLSQFVNVAETRYQVGRGLQQDILLAQLELSKLRDNTIRLQNRRENEATRLNVLLDEAAIAEKSHPSC